jgi:hypothetical protein
MSDDDAIVWEDPPPSPTGYGRHEALKVALIAQPLKWARLIEGAGTSYRGNISSRWGKAFEFAQRKQPDGTYNIWVRYNPATLDPPETIEYGGLFRRAES